MASYRKKSKKAAALIIIGASLVSSYLILKSPSGTGGSGEAIGLDFLKPSNAGFNFERKSDSLSATLSGSVPQAPEQTDNLTDNLIQNYLYEIAKRNPNGPRGKYITLPPEKDFGTILEEKLREPLGLTTYTAKDILAAKDNSKQAVAEYLESLKAAEQKAFKNNKDNILTLFEAIFAKNDPGKAYDYNNRLRNYTANLLAVRAPQVWQDFHLRLINLQQKKIALFEGLADVSSDPLKTLIAVNFLEEIVAEDGALADFIKAQINAKNG